MSLPREPAPAVLVLSVLSARWADFWPGDSPAAGGPEPADHFTEDPDHPLGHGPALDLEEHGRAALSARTEGGVLDLRQELTARFGPLWYVSGLLPFAATDYYGPELGRPLLRRLLAFSRLLPHDRLARAKGLTNALEAATARPDGRRLVNLDPGLLTLERLVLATGKNFTHRIYQGQGIWADLTLIYTRKAWQALPWTFPDYAVPDTQVHLTRMREAYHALLFPKTNSPDQAGPCAQAPDRPQGE